MTERKALTELLENVEDGEAHEVQVVAKMIASKARDAGGMFPQNDVVKAFTGSLDAAKALHDAVLPGWKWNVGASAASVFLMIRPHDGNVHEGRSDTPARAWLIAILKALIAQEDA